MQVDIGYLQFGEPLPTQQQLSRQFNVSINTVRTALQHLEKRGYLHSRQGKCATVAKKNTSAQYSRLITQKSGGIIDVYDGMATLMPDIFLEGARQCGESQIRELEKISILLPENPTRKEYVRLTSAFAFTFLSPLRNPLLTDILRDSDYFIWVPYLESFPDPAPFTTAARFTRQQMIKDILNLRCGRFDALYQQFQQLFHMPKNDVINYLKSFGASAAQPVSYHWPVDGRREHLYDWAAKELIGKILSGRYRDGDLLPSLSQLAEQYHIGNATARSVLQLLNEIGIAKTFNGKGTAVTMKSPAPLMLSPALRNNLLLYLNALQIVALSVRSVSATAFGESDRSYFLDLENRFRRCGWRDHPMQLVQLSMQALCERSPYESIRYIYTHLNKLLFWGVCMQCHPFNMTALEEIHSLFAKAFAFLRSRDTAAFSEQLSAAFRLVYHASREKLAEYGMDRAGFPAPLL